MSRYNRHDLLAYKIKVKDSISKIPNKLFIQCHPRISKPSFILNKNKNILNDSSQLSKIFPEPPKVFYRRKRNLKGILCNSDVTKRMELDESKTRNGPCYHRNCLLCTSFGKSHLVIDKQNIVYCRLKMVEPVRQKAIIYSAECLKHSKIYNKNQANRFCGHRYDTKKDTEIPSGSEKGGTELSEHFTSSPHDAKEMREFTYWTIIQNGRKLKDLFWRTIICANLKQ